MRTELSPAFFAKRDPKQAKANQKNSHAGRTRRNVIAATPDMDLLRAVLERLKKVRQREQGCERQRRRRERLARQKALVEQV